MPRNATKQKLGIGIGRGRKRSFKKVSAEGQLAVRTQVVQAVRNKNLHPDDAAALFDVSRASVFRWLAAEREGGKDALVTKKAPGRVPTLTAAQEHRMFQIMRKKTPEDFGLDFALWTRELIAEVILKLFRKTLSLPSISRLLQRLSITFKKPELRASERDPKAVMKWKRTTLPWIRSMARAARATIFYGDEAGIQSDHNAGRTWGPKGETVLVKKTGYREKVNLISAISKPGGLRFMLAEGCVDAATFCTFLDRLMKGRRRPIFLILDNASIHRSKVVKEHVASYEGKLRLYFLPPYSPDLNPDELVWNDLKTRGVYRKSLGAKGDLRKRALSHMRGLQKNPRKVAGMFRKSFSRTSQSQ
jgi:transposase